MNLPGSDKNIVGRSSIDLKIIEGADWKAAKSNDLAAAGRVVDVLWNEKKTAELTRIIDEPGNTVLITVPSSTGKNVIPQSFAFRLSHETGAGFELGEDHFDALHNKEVKNLSRVARIFFERDYMPIDGKSFQLKFRDKKIIIVEDILATGGSVKYFVNSLENNGVEVLSVVSLMGDKRLAIDQKSINRLSSALKRGGIDFNVSMITDKITRTEAGYIIMAANGAMSKDAKRRLARNLQGLSNQKAFEDLGGDRYAERDAGSERGNQSNEGVAERIPSWSPRGDGPVEKVEIVCRITVEIPNRIAKQKIVPVGPDVGKAHIEKEARQFANQCAIKASVKLEEASQTLIRAERIQSFPGISNEKALDISRGIGKGCV